MQVPPPDDSAAAPSLFAEEVARFRGELTTARSAALLHLFDYLVARSGDARAPKEIEIALAVFGRDGAPDTAAQALDSGVRVYVHRLRKRLSEFYAGRGGAKLEIPKGEYRIVLIPPPSAPADPPPEPEPEPDPAPAPVPPPVPEPFRPSLAGYVGIMLAVLTAGLVLWFLWSNVRIEPSGQRLRATAFWQPLAGGGPAHIVVGDSFLIAETENQRDIQRMVLEPGIRSRENLGSYLKTHPEAFYRLYDLDLNFTPVGTAIAAWDVQNVIGRLRSGPKDHVPLLPASRLAADLLGTETVIYVGRFAGLGRVAAPLSQASRLRTGDSYNELLDLASGKRFVADIDSDTTAETQTDYGYIASLTSPLGKPLFVIAGIGDAAVLSMAGLVASPEQLRTLETGAGLHGNYEALFEIKVMGDMALNRAAVLVRAFPGTPP